MKILTILRKTLLMLLFFMGVGCLGSYAQNLDQFVPQEIKDIEDEHEREKRTAEFIQNALNDPSSAISQYVNSIGSDNLDESGANTNIGSGKGFGDWLSNEIDKILGEVGADIMSGIKDKLTEEALSLIAGLTGASPAGEIISTRKMIKEGYTQAQKVAYQDYKVDYANMKAHTELSSDFINYYNKLDLKAKLAELSSVKSKSLTLASNPRFSSREQNDFKNLVQNLSKVTDLSADIVLVVNKGSKAVWMSEAERINILNQSALEIKARESELRTLNSRMTALLMDRTNSASRRNEARYLVNPVSN